MDTAVFDSEDGLVCDYCRLAFEQPNGFKAICWRCWDSLTAYGHDIKKEYGAKVSNYPIRSK